MCVCMDENEYLSSGQTTDSRRDRSKGSRARIHNVCAIVYCSFSLTHTHTLDWTKSVFKSHSNTHPTANKRKRCVSFIRRRPTTQPFNYTNTHTQTRARAHTQRKHKTVVGNNSHLNCFIARLSLYPPTTLPVPSCKVHKAE